MYYVYIIKSIKDKSFYVGITDNSKRRLQEHNSGKLKYTRNKKPWILWYLKECVSAKEARKEELYLKKKNRDFKESLRNI